MEITGTSLVDQYFKTLGSFWIRHFAYFSEKYFFSSPSLFYISITIPPYHIEGWKFSDWLKTKMGASSSSQSATGEDAKISEQSMNNFGLVNMADTGDGSTGFTFNLGVLIAIFLLRWCCIRKRQQNLLRMQRGMQEAMQVVVAPHAARLPVLSGAHHPPPQPAYPPPAQLPPYSGPKTSTEQVGAAIMQNYC